MKPFVLVLISCLIGAQAPAPAPAQQPVIKVTTHVVQVSVVAHDKRGEPVADLKKEDFTLFDKNQEQQIKYFAMETSKAPASDAPAPAKALAPGAVSHRVP